MHLLNTLLPKRNNLIIFTFILLIIFIITIPLILAGKNSAFMEIDPDAVYVANSLSYIKFGNISYHDHPGILSIFLMAIYLVPLRIITKGDFMKFVFDHLTDVFLYIRIFQSLLFVAGLSIYTLAFKRINNQIYTVLLALLMILSFTPNYYLGIAISSETLGFFIGTCWICIFSTYLKNKSDENILYFLAFLSGLTFANRATYIVYPISFLSILIYKRYRIKISLFVMFLGFVLGILPSIDKILIIIKRVLFFASSTGVHGSGTGFVINLGDYYNSVLIYLQRDFGLICALLLSVLIVLFFKKKIDYEAYAFGFVAIILTILFMKFPLAHYQIANYQALIFFVIYSVTRISSRIFIPLLIVYLFLGYTYTLNYYKEVRKDLGQISNQNLFIKNNPAQIGKVWNWARTEDFTKLWINEAGSGIFQDYISESKPFIYQYSDKNIFDKCWDQLYIQGTELDSFKSSYSEKVEIVKIEGSQNLYLVKSDHCKSKKL